MAKGHNPDEGSKDDVTEGTAERRKDGATENRRTLLGRRGFLGAAGAAVLAGATGAVGTSRAAEIDLGQEGLSEGDNIDGYLQEHFADGNTVYIPPGEYRTEMTWWDTSVTDAAIRGDPAGVVFRRPEGFWTDRYMEFDGHVVIENITFRGQLGHGRHRLRVNGQSEDAHMEFRNVNQPDGSVGASDAIFMRCTGSGRIDYKWCYIASNPNGAFYQLDNEPRQTFDGCTFKNSTVIHRSGSNNYTVRNCLYISDGSAPEFCENDSEEQRQECAEKGDLQGGYHRPFKFDSDYSIEGLRIENVHRYVERQNEDVGPFMDFQEDQPDVSGTIDGVYVYNASDREMFDFAGQDVSVSNVQLSGPGNLSTPEFFENVTTGEDATLPPKSSPVWTPGGEGMPLVDSSAPVEEPTPTPTPEEPEGSTFQIVSTTTGADLEYRFEVDGSVAGAVVNNDVQSVDESNDSITDNGDGTTTVVGRTGNGEGDAFQVVGTVTSFSQTGGTSGVQLLLDGEDVTGQFVGDGTDDEETDDQTDEEESDGTNDEGTDGDGSDGEESDGDGSDGTDDTTVKRVLVDGTTAPDTVNPYRIEVTGIITPDSDRSSTQDGGLSWDQMADVTNGSTAVGVVGNGVDAYEFTGEIVDLTVQGDATADVVR